MRLNHCARHNEVYLPHNKCPKCVEEKLGLDSCPTCLAPKGHPCVAFSRNPAPPLMKGFHKGRKAARPIDYTQPTTKEEED